MLSALWLFLKSRAGEWAIIAVLVAAGALWGYNHVLNKGKAEQAAIDGPKITALTAARDAAIASRGQYVGQYTKFVNDTAAAKKKQVADQQLINDVVDAQLADARAQLTTMQKTLTQKVNTYVTAQDNARCVVNTGFVRLFNDSATPIRAATGSAGESGLSGSTSLGLDTPSGIDLSAVATAAAGNNAQALYWRSQVIAWQSWYARSKASFDAARAAEDQSVVPLK